jgi:hypothetical protein
MSNEHGIPFGAPMVRAILGGYKLATRRLDEKWLKVKKGDLLWVRESWTIIEKYGNPQTQTLTIYYPADGGTKSFHYLSGSSYQKYVSKRIGKTFVSSYLPRIFSRIILEATADARLQRLQDMSDEDVFMEGPPGMIAGRYQCAMCNGRGRNITYPKKCPGCGGTGDNPKKYFRDFWESLYGAGSWDGNTELVVIEFKKEEEKSRRKGEPHATPPKRIAKNAQDR